MRTLACASLSSFAVHADETQQLSSVCRKLRPGYAGSRDVNKLQLVAAALGVLLIGACGIDDPKSARRGGPLPPGPAVDDAAGGGSSDTPAGTAGASDGAAGASAIAFCDALSVIRVKCQRCHGDPLRNGAPVPFLDFDDLHAQYYATDRQWWQVAIGMVEGDFMPYVALNDSPTLEGGTVLPLTSEEKATLLGWLKQGARDEGGADCSP
jgi:hypothetical protein